MSAALIIAIINASPALLLALERLFASFHAAGHPETAPLLPQHVALIESTVARHDPSYVPKIQFANGPQTFENPDGGE